MQCKYGSRYVIYQHETGGVTYAWGPARNSNSGGGLIALPSSTFPRSVYSNKFVIAKNGKKNYVNIQGSCENWGGGLISDTTTTELDTSSGAYSFSHIRPSKIGTEEITLYQLNRLQ